METSTRRCVGRFLPGEVLATLDAALKADRRIALFGQKEELDEAPGSASLHPVGCVGAVHALFPVPGQQMCWLVVKALQWVSLAALTSEQPYLRATSPFLHHHAARR